MSYEKFSAANAAVQIRGRYVTYGDSRDNPTEGCRLSQSCSPNVEFYTFKNSKLVLFTQSTRPITSHFLIEAYGDWWNGDRIIPRKWYCVLGWRRHPCRPSDVTWMPNECGVSDAHCFPDEWYWVLNSTLQIIVMTHTLWWTGCRSEVYEVCYSLTSSERLHSFFSIKWLAHKFVIFRWHFFFCSVHLLIFVIALLLPLLVPGTSSTMCHWAELPTQGQSTLSMDWFGMRDGLPQTLRDRQYFKECVKWHFVGWWCWHVPWYPYLESNP